MRGGTTDTVVAAAMFPHWTPHAVINRLASAVKVVANIQMIEEPEIK